MIDKIVCNECKQKIESPKQHKLTGRQEGSENLIKDMNEVKGLYIREIMECLDKFKEYLEGEAVNDCIRIDRSYKFSYTKDKRLGNLEMGITIYGYELKEK